ncbi:hypothetical protein AYO21_02962 [Fonsecaea monophora]|uniref:Acyl-CoA thioesterase II n=1 Tax=Fonsecaea monophora TaxID=254056 RepID=A0A177FHL5_9EURO|nr:hypothetical protein AYO21_02962 [Fonsecaea monophora]OAG42679.1 hypothetical protein AYO21_02962 [Fonsecaea monophora]
MPGQHKLPSSFTLLDAFASDEVDGYEVSRNLPRRSGNSAPIAYGGFALSLAVHSAYRKVPNGYHLHSASGCFLRAASTQEKLRCKVNELRRSNSFITHRVTVDQLKNGNYHACMEILMDFHKMEPSLLDYSAPPSRTYRNWRDCPTWDEIRAEWVEDGRTTSTQSHMFDTLFGLSKGLYECRPCPEGIASQNLNGMAKDTHTSQDGLHPTDKSSADWIRVHSQLQSEAEHMASLTFIMDAALSFLPLVHNHLFFEDVAACASLEFALRFFSPHININRWHLREAISHRAGAGRTYSESRVWDEEGNLVVSMSQQSICRVKTSTSRL